MDTVPEYGDWTSSPFALRRKGDRLIGLGSCDMKGGIASLLSCLTDSRGGRTKLLFCVDEENISRGAWNALRKRRGWFRDVKMVVSMEPGSSDSHSGGVRVVTLGRRGRAVISIDVLGVSAHGAMSDAGINAIHEAAKIASRTGEIRLKRHSKLGRESVFVRRIEGASTSLSVPERAHMELDFHLVPPSTTTEAKRSVEGWIRGMRSRGLLEKGTRVVVSVKKRDTPYIQPYAVSAANTRAGRVLRLIKDNFGEPIINYSLSVADDNIIANTLRVPVLTIGPMGGNEHAAGEWVSARSLGELSRLYSLMIRSG